jgi:hypothetical protein
VRIAIGAAVIGVVLIVLLLFHEAPGVFGNARSSAPSTGKASPRGTLTPDAVLSIAPRTGAVGPASSARKLPPLLQEYYDAKSYASLYARLSKSTARTGEENWMLEQMLERCAKLAEDEPERFKRSKLGDPGARARFAASLPPNDPDREKRLAAFDGINYDPCGDLANLEMSRKDLRALLQAGSDAGDPKARAALVQFDVEQQYRGPDGKWRFGPDVSVKISSDQVDTLKQAIASGDPYAIRGAMSTLMRGYDNLSLRDANDRPLDMGAIWQAETLIGCDMGFDCGANSRWLQQGCALQGYCAANNLTDYIMYYQTSPNSSQMIATYQAAIRNMLNSGDWSYFHFFPGPNPARAAFQNPGGQ